MYLPLLLYSIPSRTSFPSLYLDYYLDREHTKEKQEMEKMEIDIEQIEGRDYERKGTLKYIFTSILCSS